MIIQSSIDITSLIFDLNKEVRRVISGANSKTNPTAIKNYSKDVLEEYFKKSETIYLKLVNFLKQNPDSDITFQVILQPVYRKKKNFYYTITLLINAEKWNGISQSLEEDAMPSKQVFMTSKQVLQYLTSGCVEDHPVSDQASHLHNMLYLLQWKRYDDNYMSDDENQLITADVDFLESSLIRNLITSMEHTFEYYEFFFVQNR